MGSAAFEWRTLRRKRGTKSSGGCEGKQAGSYGGQGASNRVAWCLWNEGYVKAWPISRSGGFSPFLFPHFPIFPLPATPTAPRTTMRAFSVPRKGRCCRSGRQAWHGRHEKHGGCMGVATNFVSQRCVLCATYGRFCFREGKRGSDGLDRAERWEFGIFGLECLSTGLALSVLFRSIPLGEVMMFSLLLYVWDLGQHRFNDLRFLSLSMRESHLLTSDHPFYVFTRWSYAFTPHVIHLPTMKLLLPQFSTNSQISISSFPIFPLLPPWVNNTTHSYPPPYATSVYTAPPRFFPASQAELRVTKTLLSFGHQGINQYHT